MQAGDLVGLVLWYFLRPWAMPNNKEGEGEQEEFCFSASIVRSDTERRAGPGQAEGQ